MGKRIVPIIVFGFDYNNDRTAAGPGTWWRCFTAAELAKDLRRTTGAECLFIVSPGRAPGVSVSKQPCTMADMMAGVLQASMPPDAPVDIVVGAPVWGTRAELVEAVRLIEQKRRAGFEIDEAYLVSNTLHVTCRIRFLAWRLRRNLGLWWEWRPHSCWWMLPAWGLRARARELGKFAVELVRAWGWRPKL